MRPNDLRADAANSSPKTFAIARGRVTPKRVRKLRLLTLSGGIGSPAFQTSRTRSWLSVRTFTFTGLEGAPWANAFDHIGCDLLNSPEIATYPARHVDIGRQSGDVVDCPEFLDDCGLARVNVIDGVQMDTKSLPPSWPRAKSNSIVDQSADGYALYVDSGCALRIVLERRLPWILVPEILRRRGKCLKCGLRKSWPRIAMNCSL